MVLIIGSLICFIGIVGFGVSTNLYADFLGISKKANDFISVVSGIFLVALVLYIS